MGIWAGVFLIFRAMSKTKENKEILKTVAHSISIARAMGEPLWLGDRNHKTIYVNSVYENLSGYSLEECIGKPADFCFDKESKKRIAEHHKLRTKGKSSQYEAIIVSKTGEKVPILVSGAPTSSGGTIGIFKNLTKIKKLSRQDKVAQQIIRNSKEAIVILNKNRRITLWNSGAERMFGYKEDDVINKSIGLLIPKEEKETNKEFIKDVEQKGHVQDFEARRLMKNNETIDVSVSLTKVTDEQKNFIGYLLIYRDISLEKRVNSELQKRFTAIQDAYKELGLQRRQLDYINEIIDVTVSEESIEILEKLIVSSICLLTKCDGTILRTYDKTKDTLKLKACFGVNKKWWDKNQIYLKNSLAEEAFQSKRALIIEDIDTCSKHKGVRLLKSHKFKSLVLVPLFIQNKLIGTISLYASSTSKFRLIETDFLESIGKQFSIALYTKQNISKE